MANEVVHVAVAVLRNAAGEVLIARRHVDAHQGGLWEFPGGKVEPAETVASALQREVQEELGVRLGSARPLIRMPHDYGDKRVLLDVWEVGSWRGEPRGKEGQPVQWVKPEKLSGFDFPAANLPITNAVRLPDCYLITPEPGLTDDFFLKLKQVLEQGHTLVQLRSKSFQGDVLKDIAQRVQSLCQAYGADLLVNQAIDLAGELAIGVHLTSRQLHEFSERPLPAGQWLAASCHTAGDLEQAVKVGVDFVVLSPVMSTKSHPGAECLGWDGLNELCERACMPVYALGGLAADDVARARTSGAQGVAAIRAFWPGEV